MFYLISHSGKVVASAQSIYELRRTYRVSEYTVAQASGILRDGEYVQRYSNEYPYFGKKMELA